MLRLAWRLPQQLAAQDYIVTLDTSSLELQPGYTYAIDFVFSPGGPSSNIATVSQIDFGGGVGDPSSILTSGSVTGDGQSQPIVLSASGGYAEFTEVFTPGSQLQFSLNVTKQSDNSPPYEMDLDSFYFNILYGTCPNPCYNGFSNIATNNLNDSFLEIDTNPGGQQMVCASYSTDPNFPNICAPTVVGTVVATPAPGSLILALFGLSALAVSRILRRQKGAVL